MSSALSAVHHARSERLPVNPRRHKVPTEARKRVAKACNGCNVRRAKCSGGQPCDRCRKASRVCAYPAIEEYVTIKRSEYEALRRTCPDVDRHHSDSSPGHEDETQSGRPDSHTLSIDSHPNNVDEPEYLIDEADPPKEGRILQDPHGTVRYLGESSGATFLNHLREFMATIFPIAFNTACPTSQGTDTRFISALGRYQTHDSRPLLVSSVDPLLTPSKEQARRMLSELRYWTQNGSSTVVSGGLYYWTDTNALMTSYEIYLSDPHSAEANRSLALVNAAFAIACQLNPDSGPEWDAGHGQTFFARARALIGNPLDVASLDDASTLTLLAFYLLNSNRRDASYMYISVALHIYLVHGVHRAWSIDEDGKRKFWDAYNLDRWLSCAMGRPAIILDESIRLDIPRDAPGLPPADGLYAYTELSKITHYIAANVYGVSKHTAEPRSTALCIHKALHMLKQWEHDLPTALRYQPDFPEQDLAAYDLQMTANHLKLLAVRAWLFQSVKNVTANLCLHGRRDVDFLHREEIELAIVAARQTISILRQLGHLQKQGNVVHTVIHHAFNAALALELYQILGFENSAADREAIAFVTSLLRKQLGSNKPFSSDCAGVLSDFACMIGRLCQLGPRSGNLTGVRDSLTSPVFEASSNTHFQSGMTDPGLRDDLTSRPLDASLVTNISHLQPGDRQTAYNELVSWL